MADRSERKERLVAALSDTFCTHDYSGASVAVLARAAGLTKVSFYHYFPEGKEAMAVAALEAAEARLEAEMLIPLGGDTPLSERVDAMMVAVEERHGGGCEPGIFGQSSAKLVPATPSRRRWVRSMAAGSPRLQTP